MNLSKDKKKDIFFKHLTMSRYDIAKEYGMEKTLKNRPNMIMGVTRIYNEVRNNNEEYGVSVEDLDRVANVIRARRTPKSKDKPNTTSLANVVDQSLLDKQVSDTVERTVTERIEDMDINTIVPSVRNKAYLIMDWKLTDIAKSKKKMREVKFTDLNAVADKAFTASRVLAGEATENIALRAKIDTNMSPEEMVEAAIAMRQDNVSKNQITK